VDNLLKSRKLLRDYYSRTLLVHPSQPETETPDDKFIKQLIGLVEKYMGEADFDVIKLASELSMSRPVLYRKVKALTNLSIVEFVRTIRMNKAAQLLKSGQYRVSDVAFEVGFNDMKYFRQCFKDQFNMSPSDLMRNQDGNTQSEE
jgi:AraC-like DNA-binding protein